MNLGLSQEENDKKWQKLQYGYNFVKMYKKTEGDSRFGCLPCEDDHNTLSSYGKLFLLDGFQQLDEETHHDQHKGSHYPSGSTHRLEYTPRHDHTKAKCAFIIHSKPIPSLSPEKRRHKSLHAGALPVIFCACIIPIFV